MALIKCLKCQEEISDQAMICPKCGFNLKGEICKDIERIVLSEEKELRSIEERYLNISIETIRQGRGLIRDIMILSVTIVGFVTPLLLNSDLKLHRTLLSISALFFILIILYGVLLLVRVLRKELNNIPKSMKEALEKYKKKTKPYIEVLKNPTPKNFLQVTELEEQIIHEEVDKEITKSRWKKYINHDVGFYGLFIIAMILFVFSTFDFSVISLIINKIGACW